MRTLIVRHKRRVIFGGLSHFEFSGTAVKQDNFRQLNSALIT